MAQYGVHSMKKSHKIVKKINHWEDIFLPQPLQAGTDPKIYEQRANTRP